MVQLGVGKHVEKQTFPQTTEVNRRAISNIYHKVHVLFNPAILNTL